MTINNMHYHWQHPHMFHNTKQAQWWEHRGGRREVGANHSQTMTRWHLSEDGELNPPGDLSLKLSGTSPTPCLNQWDAQLTSWEGPRMASHRPVSGLLLDAGVSVPREIKEDLVKGWEGKNKLNNCHWEEHELPPFRLHYKGGICLK